MVFQEVCRFRAAAWPLPYNSAVGPSWADGALLEAEACSGQAGPRDPVQGRRPRGQVQGQERHRHPCLPRRRRSSRLGLRGPGSDRQRPERYRLGLDPGHARVGVAGPQAEASSLRCRRAGPAASLEGRPGGRGPRGLVPWAGPRARCKPAPACPSGPPWPALAGQHARERCREPTGPLSALFPLARRAPQSARQFVRPASVPGLVRTRGHATDPALRPVRSAHRAHGWNSTNLPE